MILKGIIDCDFTNYKEPVLTLEFPYCDFKCDKLNKCQVCQNCNLALQPNVEISFEKIWSLYEQNPLTEGFCFQGLEPFDSKAELCAFVDFIRSDKNCNDLIIIYTGYNPEELEQQINILKNYPNIIIKWGRFILNSQPHFDEILGVKLASDNQYAEKIS